MRVKRPERGGDHRPSCGSEAKESVELYLLPPSPAGPSWPVLGWTLLRFTVICVKCNSRNALLDTEFKFVEIYSWLDDTRAHASNNAVSGE